jgi:hypothetical protein
LTFQHWKAVVSGEPLRAIMALLLILRTLFWFWPGCCYLDNLNIFHVNSHSVTQTCIRWELHFNLLNFHVTVKPIMGSWKVNLYAPHPPFEEEGVYCFAYVCLPFVRPHGCPWLFWKLLITKSSYFTWWLVITSGWSIDFGVSRSRSQGLKCQKGFRSLSWLQFITKSSYFTYRLIHLVDDRFWFWGL